MYIPSNKRNANHVTFLWGFYIMLVYNGTLAFMLIIGQNPVINGILATYVTAHSTMDENIF